MDNVIGTAGERLRSKQSLVYAISALKLPNAHSYKAMK